MVCSARNEQGFVYYVYNSSWQPVDFDGLTLMRRPLPVSKKTNGERANLVDAEKNKNIAVPNLQIGRDVPHNTDTVSIARDVLGSSVANYRLETLTRHFGISEKQSHRALPDARLTASLYIKLNEKLDSAN